MKLSQERKRDVNLPSPWQCQNNREILIDSEMCFPLCVPFLKSPIDLLYILPHLLHIYETRSLETLLCRAGAAVIAVDAKKNLVYFLALLELSS